MKNRNPLFIPRNHLIEKCINEAVEKSDFSIEELKEMMNQAALELDFERAAMLRDKIRDLESS